jgi:hypothetical protein
MFRRGVVRSSLILPATETRGRRVRAVPLRRPMIDRRGEIGAEPGHVRRVEGGEPLHTFGVIASHEPDGRRDAPVGHPTAVEFADDVWAMRQLRIDGDNQHYLAGRGRRPQIQLVGTRAPLDGGARSRPVRSSARSRRRARPARDGHVVLLIETNVPHMPLTIGLAHSGHASITIKAR